MIYSFSYVLPVTSIYMYMYICTYVLEKCCSMGHGAIANMYTSRISVHNNEHIIIYTAWWYCIRVRWRVHKNYATWKADGPGV